MAKLVIETSKEKINVESANSTKQEELLMLTSLVCAIPEKRGLKSALLMLNIAVDAVTMAEKVGVEKVISILALNTERVEDFKEVN